MEEKRKETERIAAEIQKLEQQMNHVTVSPVEIVCASPVHVLIALIVAAE